MRTADSGQRLLHPIRPVALAVALIIVAGVLLVGGDRAAAQPGQLRVSAGGPYTGQVGSPVVVMAAVDFGGREPTTAISFDWDFGDGTVETGSGQTTSHVYTQPGTYTLTVTLFLLASRETATDSTTVEVSGGQVPGQLSISAGGPYSGQVGDNIIFSSRFDLGGRPPNTAIEIEWDFGDGTRDMGQTTAHVYSNPGTYTVTVTLFVLAGRETATDSTTAQIRAGSPTLSANAGGPYTGAVGQPVAMTGSASPLPADVAVNFSWTFGDGASGTGRTPSHTYSAAGTYTVTLNVTVPATGQQASATTTATISTGQPQTERVPLPTGCSNQALTWPVGTPMGTVANAVSPPGVVLSIFRLDPVQQRFRGFSPSAPSFANDYTMVESPLEAVFFCLSAPGTLFRPGPGGGSSTPTLVGPVFRWQETLLNDGQRFVPTDPSRYTLQLMPDGTAAAQVDCNRAAGSYTVSGNQLTLNFQVTTLAACPPGSLSDRYLQQLNGVASYFFRDGQLFLEIMFDSGTMRFAQ